MTTRPGMPHETGFTILDADVGLVERDGRGPPCCGSRKVRAPEGRLPGNAWALEGDGRATENKPPASAGKGEKVG